MRQCLVRGLGVLGTAIAVLVVMGLLGTGAARAASAPLKLTFVARVCPSYADVTANLARNNLQESLRDLGANSAYQPGQPIDPATEQLNQPNCTPLSGWQFTLGTSYQSAAVNGTWGSLSKVLNPFASSIVTQPSVPLLDRNGDPTGVDIQGATTVTLTSAEATAAAKSNGLWAQGGTPADPVLNGEYPGQYGFASLRCALDGLNGDNVEIVSYPQGARHELCYAYYVSPPPTSGTIIVRKQVGGTITADPQTFTFQGNISYTSDHTFSLTAGSGQTASTTFYRAATTGGEAPWSIRELTPAGWTLTDLSCTSATGASTTTTDVSTGDASVSLGAGDTVTCTYTDAVTPPAAGLTIAKRSLNGTGTFNFTETGNGQTQNESIATDDPGVPVSGGPLSLSPGDYTLSEDLPNPTGAGHWTLDSVACNGSDLGTQEPVQLSLASGSGTACLFTDTFVPTAQITVSKETLGGVGTAGFIIRPLANSADSYVESAKTTTPGQPVVATGDDTSHLALGTYEIIETTPSPPAGGYWNLDSVFCNGVPIGSAQGQVEVTLTADQPSMDCTFVNQFTPGATPADPTNPPGAAGGPGSGPTPPKPGPPGSQTLVKQLKRARRPEADLSITKTVSPHVAVPGQPVTYRVVVVNRGPGIAYHVVGTEVRSAGRRAITLHTSAGHCTIAFPARCSAARLLPHHRVVVTVHTSPGHTLGRLTNVVAVSSSTYDPKLGDNRAHATLRVRRPKPSPKPPRHRRRHRHRHHKPPRFTG